MAVGIIIVSHSSRLAEGVAELVDNGEVELGGRQRLDWHLGWEGLTSLTKSPESRRNTRPARPGQRGHDYRNGT